MENTKNWYQSKAIQGGIVSILVMASLVFNLDLDNGVITEVVQSVLGAVSSIMVIWGRLDATHKIK